MFTFSDAGPSGRVATLIASLKTRTVVNSYPRGRFLVRSVPMLEQNVMRKRCQHSAREMLFCTKKVTFSNFSRTMGSKSCRQYGNLVETDQFALLGLISTDLIRCF